MVHFQKLVWHTLALIDKCLNISGVYDKQWSTKIFVKTFLWTYVTLYIKILEGKLLVIHLKVSPGSTNLSSDQVGLLHTVKTVHRSISQYGLSQKSLLLDKKKMVLIQFSFLNEGSWDSLVLWHGGYPWIFLLLWTIFSCLQFKCFNHILGYFLLIYKVHCILRKFAHCYK